MSKQLMEQTLQTAVRVVRESPMMLSRRGINAEAFAQIVQEAVLQKPEIILCTPSSLGKAFRSCANYAIVPDGDQGAIVPFGKEAVFMPMVNGLKHIAYDELGIEIRSGAIYDGENIVRLVQGVGVEPLIEIEPSDPVAFFKQTEFQPIGAWCWLKVPDERFARLTLYRKHEIDRARSASRAKGGPWKTWPDRMAEKACVKSALNRLRYMRTDQNKRLFDAMDEDTRSEYGTQRVDLEGVAIDVTPDEPEKTAPAPDDPKPAKAKTASKAKPKTQDTKPAEKAKPKPAETGKKAQKPAEPQQAELATEEPPPPDEVPPGFGDGDPFLPNESMTTL